MGAHRDRGVRAVGGGVRHERRGRVGARPRRRGVRPAGGRGDHRQREARRRGPRGAAGLRGRAGGARGLRGRGERAGPVPAADLAGRAGGRAPGLLLRAARPGTRDQARERGLARRRLDAAGGAGAAGPHVRAQVLAGRGGRQKRPKPPSASDRSPGLGSAGSGPRAHISLLARGDPSCWPEGGSPSWRSLSGRRTRPAPASSAPRTTAGSARRRRPRPPGRPSASWPRARGRPAPAPPARPG